LRSLDILADAFGGRQMDYAKARMLTALAKDSQVDLRGTEGRYVHVRTPWTAKGMRIEPASKRGPFVSRVGTVDAVMGDLVTGDPREPATPGKEIAIPLVGPGRGRPTPQSLTRPSRWPKALVEGGDVFVGVAGHGHGEGRKLGVWKRVHRHEAFVGVSSRRQLARAGKIASQGGAGTRGGLQLLYVLRDEAEMHAGRWPMDRLVSATVEHRYPERFYDALEEVARTAHARIGD